MNQDNILRIGPNYTITNSLYQVMSETQHYTCQVMIGQRNISSADRQATADYCRETNKRLYIHTHLNNNLAKLDSSQSLRRLKKDLSIIKGIPGAAVLHVGKACDQTCKGKKPTQEEYSLGLNEVISHLNQLAPYLKTSTSPILLLENAAGQGTELGANWDDFRKIAEGLDHNYLGICLDTQHAFAAGITDWSTYDATNKVIDDALETGFPVELIHLNDSKTPFGSRVDRHDSIGQGYIWKDNQESLVELLARCIEEDRAIVLETPTQNEDLKYIYDKFFADE